jgi:hypothetical protein
VLTRGRNSQRSFAESANPMLPASLLLGHLVLDDANDGHEDGAPHAAAAHVGEDALQVETAAARRGSHYHLEDCAPQSAADNSGNGIPHRTKAFFLHGCARDVPADRTADRFND